MWHERIAPHFWWVFAVRGLAAVALGMLVLGWPALSLQMLVYLFGGYAIFNGAMAIASAIRSRSERVWALLLEGLVGIGAGAGALVWPGITATLLVNLIALWAIVAGVAQVACAVGLSEVVEDGWTSMLGGVLSIVFGAIIFLTPSAGALAMLWLIAMYAILYGMSLFVVAWRIREFELGGARTPAHV